MKKKYILEAAVFVCGAVVMIFELVGSRVLGPYFGTSIFVWTSLIGIILGSLSLGYYFGGKMADKKPHIKELSLIIFLSAIAIGVMTVSKVFLLNSLLNHFSSIRISSVIASIVLFFPASFLLGMVSPYAAKIKLNDLKNCAATVGNLYAVSTLGSIFGTFLAGFYLIPHFGTTKLLIVISAILAGTSLLLFWEHFRKRRIVFLAMLFFGWIVFGVLSNFSKENGFVDVDTEYNRVWIYDDQFLENEEKVKVMGINNERHSMMFLNSDELVDGYTRYYHLVRHFNPDFEKTLMLGGGGYSYPKDFLIKYPNATIDVVEIDPEVTELAKKYFRLKDDPRMEIFHEDGRVFLNKSERKYDAIFGDAFKSRYSVPYQLTTKEAVKKMHDMLNDDGVVILNMGASIEGEHGIFLRAQYATYQSVFPQTFLFLVNEPDDGEALQNIILVALKSKKAPKFESSDTEIQEYLGHLWKGEVKNDQPILTDDYAPVDYYISKIL
ncbi:MAG: fused MFS/spermidine synthase [Candidatus Moranbacteria bacterium]|nr:fused MFS/spermidine synthase [Candidatus Moranbacteria bacterium]